MIEISYETKQKLTPIKQRKAGDWTDTMITEAVEVLQGINPTLQLLEIVHSDFRPEIIIKAAFSGKFTVFQAPIPRVVDCILNDLPLATLSAQGAERAEAIKLEREQLEIAQKAQDKQEKLNRKHAENEAAVKAVNTVIDRFIKVAASNKDDMGMLYHVKRCFGITASLTTTKGGVVIVTNPRLEALTAKVSGQYLEIGKEACFVPQALSLKFKAGAGWKCKSKEQAETIANIWNSRYAEMFEASK